jgi:hypothetical protein
MDDRDQENLTELFARFFDTEETRDMIDNVREADQIFWDHPAPEPDELLVAKIKTDMAVQLSSRRTRLARHRQYRRAASVAAIVVIAGLFASLFNTGPEPVALASASLMPTAIWESSNIAVDDEDLAVFTAEIEKIENAVMTLESNDDISDSSSALDELEFELIVARNDFWKE